MENQHRLIKGYRELSADEIAGMNRFKQIGLDLEEAIAAAREAGAEPRGLAVAQTQLQTGLMWAIRSIAKPEGF